MLPWKYHFHFVKDPYCSFWGENVEGSCLWKPTYLNSNPSTTYCMTLENKFFKISETWCVFFPFIKWEGIVS